MQKNKYKNDFEGTYLMKSIMPKSYDLKDVSDLEPIIKSNARKTLRDNYRLMSRVGFDEDDLASIFTFYALIFLNSSTDKSPALFQSFLKQRISRYIDVIKTKAEGTTDESVRFLDYESLDSAGSTTDNPESILLAKELSIKIIEISSSRLKETAVDYGTLIYKKNKELLIKNDIQKNTIIEMAKSYALDYTGKAIIEGITIDLIAFKRLMTFKFSKFLKSLRD